MFFFTDTCKYWLRSVFVTWAQWQGWWWMKDGDQPLMIITATPDHTTNLFEKRAKVAVQQKDYFAISSDIDSGAMTTPSKWIRIYNRSQQWSYYAMTVHRLITKDLLTYFPTGSIFFQIYKLVNTGFFWKKCSHKNAPRLDISLKKITWPWNLHTTYLSRYCRRWCSPKNIFRPEVTHF